MTDNLKPKYVVVGGYNHGSSLDMIECLGVFEKAIEAYGRAYLYLSEFVDNDDIELIITSAAPLEADTGYGMWAKDAKGETHYYAYVLFNDMEEGDAI